jgi:hypothetical protein
MKSFNRYFIIFPIVLLLSQVVSAQSIDTALLKNFRVPLNRAVFHDQVIIEQKNMLKYDGKADFKMEISDNPEINYLVTRTARWEIREMLYKIEKDSTLDHSNKIRYIRGMKELLQDILRSWKNGEYNPISLTSQVAAYWYCVQLNKKGISMEDYFNTLEWEVGAPLTRTIAFENNPGRAKCGELLVKKYCILYPEKIFQILTAYPDVSFADSILKAVAPKRVDEIYNYAAASNKLGAVIRGIDDPLVKTISKMARSKSGRLYFS